MCDLGLTKHAIVSDLFISVVTSQIYGYLLHQKVVEKYSEIENRTSILTAKEYQILRYIT